MQSATANLSIVVAAAGTSAHITTSALPSGQVSGAYSASLAASGGTAPYAWSLSSGSLPAGLMLSSSGQISGTPTAAGTSSFTVTVTDSSSPAQNATANLSVVIAGATGGGNATLILCPNNGQTGNNANCAPSPTLTFGKQGTNTTSAPLTISINNCSTPNVAACTGTGSLTLGSPHYTITGANAADFSNTGLGTCSNGLVVNSGSDCTIVLRFTPSQASGVNESATLTINSNASNGAVQTMSLTGTSATVTTVSSCQALNGGTNYQLTASVSASGTCFTLGGSNIDVNLNGFTVTYGNAANSSFVGGFVNNSANTNNAVIHNGTINEGIGPNTGLGGGTGYGPGMFVCSSSSSSTASGWQMYNVTGTIKANRAKVVFVEDTGSGNPAVMHDIIFTDQDPGSCSSVSCRANDQYVALVWSDNRNGAAVNAYNITGTGAPQGGVVSFSPGSTINNNNIAPGGVSATVSNGFSAQLWGSNQVAQNNLIQGTGPNGSCVSCRGIQTGSAGSNTSTNNLVQNNVLRTYNLANDPEYGGCQIDGSFGIQINTAGSSQQTTNHLIQNNKVYVNSGACPGFAFSWSGANTPASNTKNNHFSCTLVSGSGPCAGARFDANQYNPHQAGVISTGDTFVGDTSSIYIWYDGTPTWTCHQCTFGKGSNPISGWVMIDNDGGGQSGQSSDPMFLIDPTFTGGATKDSNNLSKWASNNASLSFSYTVQWTYTVVVKGASSGSTISGATVTATDSQGGQECNGTTDANGVFSCVVSDTKYGAAGGTYTVTSLSPFGFRISASGCTTLNYTEAISSTTTETKAIPGC